MRITHHARLRMEERGITVHMVESALSSQHGDMWEFCGKVHRTIYGLTIVTDKTMGAIVTVYASGYANGKYCPKRSARVRGRERQERERRRKLRQAW